MAHVLLLFMLYAITAASFNLIRWMWRRLRELRTEERSECWHSPLECDGRLWVRRATLNGMAVAAAVLQWREQAKEVSVAETSGDSATEYTVHEADGQWRARDARGRRSDERCAAVCARGLRGCPSR